MAQAVLARATRLAGLPTPSEAQALLHLVAAA